MRRASATNAATSTASATVAPRSNFRQRSGEEIVAAVPGAKQSQINRPQLPPLEILAPLFAEAEAARDEDDRDAFEEIALRLAGAVVGILAPMRPRRARQPSGRDVKRVTAIERVLAAQPEESYSLDGLASQAAMSPLPFPAQPSGRWSAWRRINTCCATACTARRCG